MPVHFDDPLVALVGSSSDFVQAMDSEPLQVSGLPNGKYDLSIDNKDCGQFTNDQLAAGINLALLPTPMLGQADMVGGLVSKHDAVHYTRWRGVQVPLEGDADPAVKQRVADLLAALDAEEQGVVDQLHKAAQPVTHYFSLVKLPS